MDFLFFFFQISSVSKEELRTDDHHSIKGNTHRDANAADCYCRSEILVIAEKINQQFAV